MTTEQYSGGAHGYSGEYGVSFAAETGEKLSLTDIVTDQKSFIQYEYSRYGYALSDPQNMILESRMEVFGSYSAYRRYAAGANGVPEKKEDYYQLSTLNNILRNRYDLTCEIVDLDGAAIDEETLKAGTCLVIIRTDGENSADVQIVDPAKVREGEYSSDDFVYFELNEEITFDESQPIYRIHFEMDDEYWHTVSGYPESEMFDGLLYAG